LPNTNAYTNTAAGIPIPHGLGYPPLAFTWSNFSNFSGTAASATSYGRSPANVDNTYIYVNPSSTNPIFVVAYAIDLRKDVDYTTYPGNSNQSPYDSNYGIKLVKKNKDINSKDLRDFILHSRAQSPLIQAVKTEKTINPANPSILQYTNHMSYPVWVYGFARQIIGASAPLSHSDFYKFAQYSAQAYPKTTTNGFVSSINFIGTSAGGATIVVLRDPMFAATALTVQY